MNLPETVSNEINAELQRVVKSSQFKSSPRITELLEHIIQAHIKGKSNNLTGITIAQDLFGMDESFDPSKNPVVRVNVARLRHMLDKYYQAAGQSNPLKISIPKGSYVPLIEQPSATEQPPSHHSQRFRWALVLSSLVAATVLLLFSKTPISIEKPNERFVQVEEIKRYPTVIIVPFENLTNDPQFESLEAGFQRQLVADFYPFRVLRVLQSEASFDALSEAEIRKADYAISGSINSVEPVIDLTINLIELPGQKTILKERVSRDSGSSQYFDMLRDISSQLSNGFAGPEGALVKERINAIKDRMDTNSHTIKNLSAFECFSRFREYLSAKKIASLKSAYNCLEEELEYDPTDSTLTSALALLTYDIGYFNEHEEIAYLKAEFGEANFDKTITTKDGLNLAKKAVKLDPSNDIARGNLADFQMAFDDIDGAYISLQQAITSNRGNPAHLANFAIVLAYMGRWEEAEQLSKEASARNPDGDWYYSLPVFYKAIVEGDGDVAKQCLPHVTKNMGNYMTNMFSFFAASVSNDHESLNNLRPIIQGYVDSHQDDPLKLLRISGGSEEIFDTFKREMRRSGIEF